MQGLLGVIQLNTTENIIIPFRSDFVHEMTCYS